MVPWTWLNVECHITVFVRRFYPQSQDLDYKTTNDKGAGMAIAKGIVVSRSALIQLSGFAIKDMLCP